MGVSGFNAAAPINSWLAPLALQKAESNRWLCFFDGDAAISALSRFLWSPDQPGSNQGETTSQVQEHLLR